MYRFAVVLFTLIFIASILLAGCSRDNPPSTSPAPAATPAASTTPVATPDLTTATPITTPTPAVTTEPAAPPEITATPAPDIRFQASSPVATFSAEDIAFLGTEFSGSPLEIADAIKKWQEDTWFYASGAPGYENASDPIRWNYFLPGIFSSGDIIREQVKDGHIYGVCFSYAVTYCSIAEYYGLEARVVNSLSKPSDSDPNITTVTGMSPEEYERLKLKLDKWGLKYDYAVIQLVAEETPTHYWAEVKIDGRWIIKDATQKATGGNTQENFVAKNDYEITDWLGRDRFAEMDEYQQMLDKGEPLPVVLVKYPSPDRPKDYKGTVDDLGQKGRAAIIDDLLKGWALAPYFNEVSDAYAFIKATNITQSAMEDQQKLKSLYESLSGRKMYTVTLLVCQGKTGRDLEEWYYNLCGEELDTVVLEQLLNQFAPQQ